MTKIVYDITKVSREALEQYAVRTIAFGENVNELATDIREQATVSLRSRADVKTDIDQLVADYAKFRPSSGVGYFTVDATIPGHDSTFKEKFYRLLDEKTWD